MSETKGTGLPGISAPAEFRTVFHRVKRLQCARARITCGAPEPHRPAIHIYRAVRWGRSLSDLLRDVCSQRGARTTSRDVD